MRTLKLVAVIIVISFLGIFFYQNKEILSSNVSFLLRLYVVKEITWSLSLLQLVTGALLVGFVLGGWIFLKGYMRKRGELKRLTQSIKHASPAGDPEKELAHASPVQDSPDPSKDLSPQ